MTTSKNGRASLSASTGALLAIPYSGTQAEPTLSQNSTAYTVADPAYLSIQV